MDLEPPELWKYTFLMFNPPTSVRICCDNWSRLRQEYMIFFFILLLRCIPLYPALTNLRMTLTSALNFWLAPRLHLSLDSYNPFTMRLLIFLSFLMLRLPMFFCLFVLLFSVVYVFCLGWACGMWKFWGHAFNMRCNTALHRENSSWLFICMFVFQTAHDTWDKVCFL